MKRVVTISLAFVTMLTLLSCGGGASDETDLPTLGNECLLDSDCDGDGLYTSCDDDDGDATNAAIKDGCDTDLDGFVDIYCTAYEMKRDLNEDGLITEDERDINCDTCPPGDPTSSYNPEQTDSDLDGIGDLCSIDANINIGAVYDDPGTTTDTDTDTDASDTENPTNTPEETTPLVINVVAIDDSGKIGGNITTDFDITGDAVTDATYTVELVIKKSGTLKSASGLVASPGIAGLGIASDNFCLTTTTGCITLGPVAIILTDDLTSFSADFDVPEDLDEGKYAAQIRLVATDADGQTEVVAKDKLTSRIEIKESSFTFPGTVVDSGIKGSLTPQISKNQNHEALDLPKSPVPSSY